MSTIASSPPPVPITTFAPATVLPASVRFFDRLFQWIERTRQRRILASLDDRMLRDIGLSRLYVTREVTKSFWQY